ncbi:MAG: arginine--tRNA ligase [Parcubacteria group bacterium]|nr:arginine--tRNA ligase [Parcubacteria group bacterium]
MQDKIKKALSAAVQLLYRDVKLPDFLVAAPENAEHGDYASNIALALAKTLRRNPMEVADEIVTALKQKLGIGNWELGIKIAPPGFINFYLTQKQLGETLKDILKKKEKFGRGQPKKETIVIEYSSPNIAKPLGIHHLRTTVIGQALVNVLRFTGYKAVSLSFPGDWGTQFGHLIAGYKKWGDPKKIRRNPIKELLNLYVMFSQAAQGNPEMIDEGRLEFKKLEEGNKENLKLWRWFAKESYKDFDRIYKMLGVKIEHTIGESFYEPELKKLVDGALEKGLAQKGSDGSVVIPIPDSPTPEIIRKSDGATIYTTREVAAIRHRIKKWQADKILYVAANQQTFHLEQVFKSAEILGFAKKDQLAHVKFGMVLAGSGKKFATREGNLIPMENVLNEAISRALKIVNQLNPKLPPREKQKVAQTVGIGAVKFFDLSQNRLSDIVFDWNKMLNLKGASAPYIQYSYARLKSVLRKAGRVSSRFDPNNLKTQQETALMRHLIHFPEVVADSAKRYEPNHIAEFLLKLAEKVNHFYEITPILKADQEARAARLALVKAATIIIQSGCGLLGIEVPEGM